MNSNLSGFTKFGLEVRLVDESDAEFITSLRKDEQLSKYVHAVTGGVEEQREWIRLYKEREKKGEELYFIYLKDGIRLGVNRIYGINNHSLTIGSWMFRKNIDSNWPIYANIIMRDIAFEYYPGYRILFDIRKLNHKVLRFNRMFSPVLIDEDELSYYFEMSYEGYQKGRSRILKLLS